MRTDIEKTHEKQKSESEIGGLREIRYDHMTKMYKHFQTLLPVCY